MTVDVAAARNFVHAEGRLVEQLVHAALFDDGDAEAVVRAVAAYQNDDGGFGHGLEPDKRAPGSQPLDVEIALERLVTVAAKPPADLAARACDFLDAVADPGGAVPVLLPSIAGYPRAAHWSQTDHYEPGLNPTASIAGHLHALGVDHPWRDRATTWCLSAVEHDGLPDDVHALLCVTRLLDQVADREGAASLAAAVAAALPDARMFQPTPDPDEYGVTPLAFAPTPASPARAWFDDAVVKSHLGALERQQQADGGWPLAWEPPSRASRCEWRAIRTVEALLVLSAYGRI